MIESFLKINLKDFVFFSLNEYLFSSNSTLISFLSTSFPKKMNKYKYN